MQDDLKQNSSQHTHPEEIDLLELAGKVWSARKMILRNALIGAAIGLVIAFSIPKEYTTTVKLSPESADAGKMGQLGGMASMLGMNLGGKAGSEALTVELYPDIVSSTPFLLEFVDLPIQTQNGKIDTTLYAYLGKHQKQAWWNHVKQFPFKAIGWSLSLFKEKKKDVKMEIDPFHLTPEQEGFVGSLSQKVVVSTDKKTGTLIVSATMQDPKASAQVVNAVLEKLQAYITDYRTHKAKKDMEFTQKLYVEAREKYYQVQKSYARYVDENRNVVQASYRIEEERLNNEVALAYGVYNQMAQQLEANKIKVQEQTPVYTIIEPARVPLRAVKPNKPIILIGFMFLAGVLSVCWILVKDLFGGNKTKKEENITNNEEATK